MSRVAQGLRRDQCWAKPLRVVDLFIARQSLAQILFTFFEWERRETNIERPSGGVERERGKKNTEVRAKGEILLLFLIYLHGPLVCPRMIHIYGDRVFIIHVMFIHVHVLRF